MGIFSRQKGSRQENWLSRYWVESGAKDNQTKL